MKSATMNLILSRLLRVVELTAITLVLVLATAAQTPTKKATTAAKAAPAAKATTAAKAKTFATPQQAASALVDAAEKFDVSTLDAILGPEGYDIIHSGEEARDREQAKAFAAMAREKQHVDINGKLKDRATLNVGADDWPFPIPIVKRAGHWSFDTKVGRQEILRRRVGRNELDAIQICQGYVEAQHEYALMKRDVYKVNQYAQRIIATPGQEDGLAWQNTDGSWGGPVGENVARAIKTGYTSKTEPYHGYYFKVLKGQGPDAPLGQLDYVIKGVMIGGFALVASPAQYGVTGIKSFLVSQDGVVYEKDLGPNTSAAFAKMDRFNPDKTWRPVNEP
jgi:hypothetical protein